MTCPDCAHRLEVIKTMLLESTTQRLRQCACGSRFLTLERVVKRLPALPATTRQPAGNAPATTSQPLPIFSSQDLDPDIPGDQTGARRATVAPRYPLEFEEVWAATDRRGSKNKALKAWKAKGSPSVEIVRSKRKEYLASLESWRNPQDISTWINDFGHTHIYGPPPPEKKRNGVEPIAVRLEREREERHLEEQAAALFGTGSR